LTCIIRQMRGVRTSSRVARSAVTVRLPN
jgi:hypothetical protein